MRKAAFVVRAGTTLEEGIKNLVVQEEEFPILLSGNELEGGDDVLIEVRAVAINYPDLLQTVGGYQHKRQFPYIPAFELAGVILKVGDDVRKYAPGDRVMCMSDDGALATHVVVQESQILPIPDPLTFEQGAGFLMGYRTAYHCLVERAKLEKGEWVLVNSTGGMSLAAAEMAKRLGAKVIVTGSSDEKLAVVKAHAKVDHVINYSKLPEFRDKVKELSGGGVNVVFDPVGGDVWDQSVRSTAFGARLLVVGFTSQARPEVKTNIILIKGLTVLGCRAGEFPKRMPDGMKTIEIPRLRRIMSWASQGKLQPYISHKFSLTTEGVQESYRTILHRKVIGRVVVCPQKTSDEADEDENNNNGGGGGNGNETDSHKKQRDAALSSSVLLGKSLSDSSHSHPITNQSYL